MATYSSIDPPKKKSSVNLHFKHGKVKKTFKPADERTGDPNYGPESKTKATPAHVVKAQKAGADLSEHGGKSYRAGYTSIEKHPNTVSISHGEKTTPTIPKLAPSAMERASNQKKLVEIRQKSGTGMKRRLPRVNWLKGQNKRTESGFGR